MSGSAELAPVRAGAELARSGPAPADLARCRALLAAGSKSFAAAGRILPPRLRDPAAVLYGFCRVADDAVDDSPTPAAAVERLTLRLDAAYRGAPAPDPVDRALSWLVATYPIPRRVFDALLEGFAWDAEGRSYPTESALIAYAARVAGTVGIGMSVLMGARQPEVWARACDLGVAMQLVNVARDVGEDAARGRCYLPASWLAEHGLSPAEVCAARREHPGIAAVVARLLARARPLFRRAEAGIGALAPDCRAAIWAARWLYEDIGRVIARRGHRTVTRRAYTGTARKLVRVAQATLWARLPQPVAGRDAPALPEVEFLLAP